MPGAVGEGGGGAWGRLRGGSPASRCAPERPVPAPRRDRPGQCSPCDRVWAAQRPPLAAGEQATHVPAPLAGPAPSGTGPPLLPPAAPPALTRRPCGRARQPLAAPAHRSPPCPRAPQVVLVRGNARTRQSLIGQRAVVRRAVGLGGWHWLVSSRGATLTPHAGGRRRRGARAMYRHPPLPASPPAPPAGAALWRGGEAAAQRPGGAGAAQRQRAGALWGAPWRRRRSAGAS